MVKGDMKFNINKYNNRRFHKDDINHKRIKALLLWWEYEVNKRNLSPIEQIDLLKKWIGVLIKQEYYELVPFFKTRLNDIIKEHNCQNKDNLSLNFKKELFLIIKRKITWMLRLILSKK